MPDLPMVVEYLRHAPLPVAAPLRHAVDRYHSDMEQLSLAFSQQKDHLPIAAVPEQTKAVLELLMGPSPDLIYRDIALGTQGRHAILFFADHLVSKEQVMTLLDALSIRLRHDEWPAQAELLAGFVRRRASISSDVDTCHSIGDVTSAVLSGDSVLLVDGLQVGIRMATRGWEHRAPEEPASEPVIRGPKEGFVETLSVNIALVRRRIQSEELRIQPMVLGQRSRRNIVYVYLAGLTLPDLVDEVRSRLDRIRVDGVVGSGKIEEMIQDNALTPFPLVRVTERPDVVEAQLLEGKVAILIDGTPHVLVVPETFSGEMQAAEDYYQHWTAATFLRLLRYLYLLVALLGPSVYVAVTTFHQEMLPTQLLLSLMGSREGLPFPAALEALLMELSLETLREAGVRLPKPVGQAISIVGGLVIGEAAVRAGIVSPVMVIVVAITAISSFIIPAFGTGLAIRILRFPMMVLAATLGFYGITLGLVVISLHLASLRSFGVPYMSPIMPPTLADMKDMMIRAPWWWMRKRPKFMPVQDRVRVAKSSRPNPGQRGGTS